MNKIISIREIISEVCIVLEKERNNDSIVFTSMNSILKKIKKQELKTKDIKQALDYLVSEGKIEVLSKSNRQTVLKLKENLFEIDLDNIKENLKNEKELALTITPKRLLDVFKENAKEGLVEVKCSEVRNIFNCSYNQVKAALKMVQKKYGLETVFEKGIIQADLNQISISANIETNVFGDVEHDSVFDYIGESLEAIFEELHRLRKENGELNKKVAMMEISNKRLREENASISANCDALIKRNDRLYYKMIQSSK